MNPTEKQIKEFWEWCGFAHPTSIRGVKDPSGWWLYPESPTYAQFNPPKINLNNLFKYAMPKVYSWTMGSSFPNHQETLALVNYNNKCGEAVNLDPTLALFWAIWEVIH